ncbi:hypothetical protein LSTR_LSTR011655 [Laodelphax striatellus]|uniref:Uncharacterized protein n=1 Tax=Laodelphax striatellus TaxID=195883 RepID=A0A482WKM8_LAOST|nr:hypothetical protein LSTR_LSTR011655 [Laodelphax striatellus]
MVSVWLGNQPHLTPSPESTPPERPPTPPPLPPPPKHYQSTPVNPDYGSMVSVWLGNQPHLTPSPESTPPERPPTPPPLPPPPKHYQSTPVNPGKGKRRCFELETSKEDQKSPAAMLGDVLKQLSTERPQLRHVKRSPGGSNPEKTPKVLDPSDVLAKILRKRFQAFHMDPSDTDDTEDSFHNTAEFMNEVLTSPASLV